MITSNSSSPKIPCAERFWMNGMERCVLGIEGNESVSLVHWVIFL